MTLNGQEMARGQLLKMQPRDEQGASPACALAIAGSQRGKSGEGNFVHSSFQQDPTGPQTTVPRHYARNDASAAPTPGFQPRRRFQPEEWSRSVPLLVSRPPYVGKEISRRIREIIAKP